jgi:4-hydroxy-tetrahydrodipicolinate synthase
MKSLIGTGVAMVTPFEINGHVDVAALTRLTHSLVDGRVDYLVVLGSTGEAATQFDTDQDLVIRTVQEANAGRLPIVLGVGGNDTAAVAAKTYAWTERYKPAAFLSVSPMYNKPSQEGIYQHFKAVADSTDLPIILYNVPGRTGSNMLASTTLRLAHDFKNVVAIKEASGNMEQCMEIADGAPEGFLPISGDDLLALPLIACGYQGVISVAGNALPRMTSDLVRLALSGNYAEARALHYRLLAFTQLIFAEGNPAGIKVALDLLGICGPSVRLPLIAGSERLRKQLLDALEGLGS